MYQKSEDVARDFRIKSLPYARGALNMSDTMSILDNAPHTTQRRSAQKTNIETKFPNISITKDLAATITRNLRFTESIEKWQKFYVYSGSLEAKTYDNRAVDKDKIINYSPENDRTFQADIISSFKKHTDTDQSNIFFITGTTGVGKTTFVKFHCATKCFSYYDHDIIPFRVRFRDLEATMRNVVSSPRKKSQVSIYLEEYIKKCMIRDIVKYYRYCKKNNKNIFKEIELKVNESIRDLENQIYLSVSQRNFLVNFLDNYNDDQFISADIEIIDFLLSGFSDLEIKYLMFLDGFDAVEPELINLFGDPAQSHFLNCLLYIVESVINNTSGIEIFNMRQCSIVISCRPITVSQIRCHINRDQVDFDAIIENEYYITPSDVIEVVNKRMEARAELGAKWENYNVKIVEFLCVLCINKIKRIFPILNEEQGIISALNYNSREKMKLLHNFIELFFEKFDMKCVQDSIFFQSVIDSYSNFERLKSLLVEVNIADYEVDRLFILGGNERFLNTFEAKGGGMSLREVDYSATFDNIFSYIHVDKRRVFEVPKNTFTKIIILKELSVKKDISEIKLKHILDNIIGDSNWSILEWKILIRNGFIVAHFSDQCYFNITKKGRLVLDNLLFHNVYFERVIQKTLLIDKVRDKLLVSRKAWGRTWGRKSVYNMCLFLKYISTIENEMELPDTYRISSEVRKRITSSIDVIVAEGFKSEDKKTYKRLLHEKMAEI